MPRKVYIKGYDTKASADDDLQRLNVELYNRVSVIDNAAFVDGFINDLQEFIDEKYNK